MLLASLPIWPRVYITPTCEAAGGIPIASSAAAITAPSAIGVNGRNTFLLLGARNTGQWELGSARRLARRPHPRDPHDGYTGALSRQADRGQPAAVTDSHSRASAARPGEG